MVINKLDLGIAALLGAIAGTVIGYFAYAVGSGADGAHSFSGWLEFRFFDRGGYLWTIGGAIWFAAKEYLTRQNSN